MKSVPLIVSSDAIDREKVISLLNSGVSEFIVRPLDQNIIKEKITKFLSPPKMASLNGRGENVNYSN